MKFTKEDAIKELEAKFAPKVEKIDDWKRTITESVEHAIKLIGDSSEIELQQFVELVMPFLNTTNGFINKKVSTATTELNGQIETLKNKVTDLEKKNGGGKGNDKNENHDDDEIAQLRQRLDELEKANKQSKAEKTISEKKSEIKSKLKEKGVKREDWIDLMLSEANITEETDIEAKAESYLTMYNKMYAGVEESITPPSAGGGGENPNKKIQDVVNAAAEIAKQRIN